MNTKICYRCEEDKPLSEYGKVSRNKDGLKHICRQCSNEDHKNCYQRHRVEYIEKAKAYHSTLHGQMIVHRTQARSRGIGSTLTDAELTLLFQVPCTYCGDTTTGINIDRVDSNISYTLSNVVPCCGTCNRMKNDHSLEFFIEHIKKVLMNANIKYHVTDLLTPPPPLGQNLKDEQKKNDEC